MFLIADAKNSGPARPCHTYYQAGAFHGSDGTILRSLDVSSDQPLIRGDGLRVPASVACVSVCDLQYDRQGRLRAAFLATSLTPKFDSLSYQIAAWDAPSAQWLFRRLVHAGSSLIKGEWNEAGGIAFDPEDDRVVYVAADVDPATGVRAATGRHQLFRGTADNQGEGFTWEQLTFDASRDNIRPFVPRGRGTKGSVMWLRGTYRSRGEHCMDILGLGL
jgi:hypothetical protein